MLGGTRRVQILMIWSTGMTCLSANEFVEFKSVGPEKCDLIESLFVVIRVES